MIKKYFIENVKVLLRDKSNVTAQFWINQADFRAMHSHEDYWEFSVVMSGTIHNHLNGETFVCPPGTMFYCTTKDVHSLASDDNNIRYVNFTVAQPTVLNPTLTSSLPLLPRVVPETVNSGAIVSITNL